MASLFLVATGCGNESDNVSQQGNSFGIVSEPAGSSLKPALREARDQKVEIDQRRVQYQEQTAAKVSAEQAYLFANMDNYSATASGVRARMNQGNYIKEIRIAGLRAEQRLLEHGLPLLRAMEAAKGVNGAGSVRNPTAIIEQKLIDETHAVGSYLRAHTLVHFPTRDGVPGRVKVSSVAEETPTDASNPSLEDLISETVENNRATQ